MAAKQDEIIRELDDGFVVAWDTEDVPVEVRKQFRDATKDQIDILMTYLGESGETKVVEVEVKSTRRPGKARKGSRSPKQAGRPAADGPAPSRKRASR